MKIRIIWKTTEVEVQDDYVEAFGAPSLEDAVRMDMDQDPISWLEYNGPDILSVEKIQ